mmetsp:Transcript_10/g.41  ORF Transcript_10/g.41 Transcript_10/m.41 type:complete len:436 (-) Transcript_10:253-1560(-)
MIEAETCCCLFLSQSCSTRQPSRSKTSPRTRTIPLPMRRTSWRRLVVPEWTSQGCMIQTSPVWPSRGSTSTSSSAAAESASASSAAAASGGAGCPDTMCALPARIKWSMRSTAQVLRSWCVIPLGSLSSSLARTHRWLPRTKHVLPPPSRLWSESSSRSTAPWNGCPRTVRTMSAVNPGPASMCQPLPRTRRRLTGCQPVCGGGCPTRFRSSLRLSRSTGRRGAPAGVASPSSPPRARGWLRSSGNVVGKYQCRIRAACASAAAASPSLEPAPSAPMAGRRGSLKSISQASAPKSSSRAPPSTGLERRCSHQAPSPAGAHSTTRRAFFRGQLAASSRLTAPTERSPSPPPATSSASICATKPRSSAGGTTPGSTTQPSRAKPAANPAGAFATGGAPAAGSVGRGRLRLPLFMADDGVARHRCGVSSSFRLRLGPD